VKDIFIAGVDGLKEFPEIIESIHPRTQVQLCMAAQASRQRSAVGLSRGKQPPLHRQDEYATVDELETLFENPL